MTINIDVYDENTKTNHLTSPFSAKDILISPTSEDLAAVIGNINLTEITSSVCACGCSCSIEYNILPTN